MILEKIKSVIAEIENIDRNIQFYSAELEAILNSGNKEELNKWLIDIFNEKGKQVLYGNEVVLIKNADTKRYFSLTIHDNEEDKISFNLNFMYTRQITFLKEDNLSSTTEYADMFLKAFQELKKAINEELDKYFLIGMIDLYVQGVPTRATSIDICNSKIKVNLDNPLIIQQVEVLDYLKDDCYSDIVPLSDKDLENIMEEVYYQRDNDPQIVINEYLRRNGYDCDWTENLFHWFKKCE